MGGLWGLGCVVCARLQASSKPNTPCEQSWATFKVRTVSALQRCNVLRHAASRFHVEALHKFVRRPFQTGGTKTPAHSGQRLLPKPIEGQVFDWTKPRRGVEGRQSGSFGPTRKHRPQLCTVSVCIVRGQPQNFSNVYNFPQPLSASLCRSVAVVLQLGP